MNGKTFPKNDGESTASKRITIKAEERQPRPSLRPMQRKRALSNEEVIASYMYPRDLPEPYKTIRLERLNTPHPYLTRSELQARLNQASLTGIIVD